LRHARVLVRVDDGADDDCRSGVGVGKSSFHVCMW
jgi:hypothetical protein